MSPQPSPLPSALGTDERVLPGGSGRSHVGATSLNWP